jgi:cobaltochelatase CobN
MLFFANLIDGQHSAYDFLIRQLEQHGINVIACFGNDRQVLDTLLLDRDRRSRVDLVVAFSLKLYSAIDDDLRRALIDMNVPVLDAVNLYSNTIDAWRQDPIGIRPLEVVWTIAVPEMSGAAQPTPITGKIRLTDPDNGKRFSCTRPLRRR